MDSEGAKIRNVRDCFSPQRMRLPIGEWLLSLWDEALRDISQQALAIASERGLNSSFWNVLEDSDTLPYSGMTTQKAFAKDNCQLSYAMV
jgi:hypothetical protein